MDQMTDHSDETPDEPVVKPFEKLAGLSGQQQTSKPVYHVPLAAFGTVTFSANGNTSDFIRVSPQQMDADSLLKHLCNRSSNNARVDSLELVISVHGTLDESSRNADAEKEFNKLKEALATILIIGNGWVVSPGESSNQLLKLMDVDQRELEVDLSRSYNFVSVAFVDYETLVDKTVLDECDSSELRKYPSPHNDNNNSNSENLHLLSSENTHLVVVCDSKSAEKDEGQNHIRELRSSFEECLVEKRRHNLPILNVFAGGSDADINSMMQKLDKNQIVILLSGLATDSSKLNSKNAETWKALTAHKKKENFHVIDLLTLDSHKQMYVIGSKVLSPEKRIKLAVFDSLDGNLRIVLDELASDPTMESFCLKAFQNALIEKQFQIVEGIVSSGFDLSKHFDNHFLLDLYISAMTVSPALLEFINDYMPIVTRMKPDLFQLKYLNDLLKEMLKKSGCTHTALNMNQHLFLFSLMQLDKSMSEFFWKRCDEPMASALLAKLLLDQMESSSEFGQWKSALDELTSHFEQQACDFLNKFYGEDEEMAMENLKAEQQSWFDLKPLDLAEKGNCNIFFSQFPVHRLQMETFFGKIMTSCSWIRLLLCVTLVIPVGVNLPWVAEYKGNFYQMKGFLMQQMVRDRSNSKKRSHNLDPPERVKRQLQRQIGLMFYSVYTSPVVKYIIDTIYTLGIVIAQSYMLTVVFQLREKVSLIEWILLGLNVSNLFKDIVSCLYYDKTRRTARVQQFYMSNKWLIVSTITSVTFIFATTLHALTYDNVDASEWCQVFYMLSNFLNYGILLRSCLVWDYVGPYIVMMAQMTRDLLVFLVVVLIFTIGYGICLQSILYSNIDGKITWGVIFGILLKPILHVFGENFLDNLSESGECDADSNYLFKNCQLSFLRPVVGLILFLCYATLVNLMLVNLLIAVFSNTYTEMNANITLHWNLIFYRVAVKYYSRRNNYPGPIFFLIFVVDLFRLLKKQGRSCVNRVCHTMNGADGAEQLEKKQKEFKAKKMEILVFQKSFNANLGKSKIY
ncbi:transient receptor potential cation channel subfamily M member 8-like isoform X3 [Symsagittifera roscoffensis]